MVTTESPASRVGPITLSRKQTGKPIAGNRHDGFEVAGAGTQLTVRLLRHSQRKRGATDRRNLRSMALALDPTSPMPHSREHFPRSLVESAEIVPNSHSPHGNSEVRPATGPSVCVEYHGVARRFHSAVCVLFYRRHRHRRKPGWSEFGRSLRRKDVSNRSLLAGCTQERKMVALTHLF